MENGSVGNYLWRQNKDEEVGMCHVAMLKVPKQRKGRRLCMAQWEWGPGMYLTLRSHLFQFNLLHISQFPLSCGPLITLFEKIAPSVNDIRAGPSHGSNRAEKYSYKAFRSKSHILVILPCFRYHHHDSFRETSTCSNQKLKNVIKSSWIRWASIYNG